MSDVFHDHTPAFPRIWFGDGQAEVQAGGSSGVRAEPLAAIRNSFERLTGWSLCFAERPSSVKDRERRGLGPDHAMGKLEIDDLSVEVGPGKKALDRRASQRLADDISQLWEQLRDTRAQLEACQLELATSVAVSLPAGQAGRLEKLIQQLLGTALEQGGFESVSLWLVDDDTLTLRRRKAAGPHFSGGPRERHLGEARADVRAMTGNVIVMQDRNETRTWQAPVECGSAVCVPVSSMSNLYGTLWLARDSEEDVSSAVTTVLEIIAGRIAAELEQAALLRKIQADREDVPALECDAHRDDGVQADCGPGAAVPVAPPFAGWALEAAPADVPRDPAAGGRQAWFRVTAAESMLLVAVHVSSPQSRPKLGMIGAALDAFCALGVSPATMVDGLHRLYRQRFDDDGELSVCCIEVDPLTGEYRWTSRGSEWGQLTGTPGCPESRIAGGASVLPRQHSLTISVPGPTGLWQPSLILTRTGLGHAADRFGG